MPRVRLLGVLEVRADGPPLTIPGERARAVLARLALAAGQVVSTGRLVDDVWGERPPAGAVNALQARVSALRRQLAGRVSILSRPPGYQLVLDDDDVDALHAQRLVTQARAVAGGDPAAAMALLEDAVALWSGTPFEGLGDAAFVPAARAHWSQLNVAARYELYLLRVQSGQADTVISGIESLAAEQPLHEPVHELLVTAYARLGRQADALDALRRVRASLREDLGIDPGAGLRLLEEQVLRQDPALLAAGPPAPVGAAPGGSRGAPDPRPARPEAADSEPPAGPAPHVPRPLSSFLHREDDLAVLRAMVTDHRLVTVAGPGGVGKTRVAIRLAEGLDPPDGCWFVALDGVGEPAAVPAAVALAFGITAGDPAGALAARFRTADALLVLDNCEHLRDAPARLVEQLLRSCPTLRVLATSQRPLGLVGEAVRRLGPLDGQEAVALFLARAREHQRDLVLDDAELRAVAAVCRRLEGLPLAIELAAARVPSLSVAELDARLPDPLAVPADTRTGRPERQQTLAATIAWSCAPLPPLGRLALQALAVFPSGAPLSGMEVVLGELGVDAGMALDLVTDLVEGSLAVVDRGVPAEVRFRLPDSVRAYAAAQAAREGRRAALDDAFTTWVLDLSGRLAGSVRGGDQAAALRRLVRERPALDAGLALARVRDPERALRASSDLAWGWLVVGDVTAGAERLRLALDAAAGAGRAGPGERCLALGRLALLLHRVPDIPAALSAASQAVDVAAADLPGDVVARARADGVLGLVLVDAGRSAEGTTLVRGALGVLRDAGERWDAGMCLLRLAYAASLEGDVSAGEDLARQALEAACDPPDTWVEHAVWRLLGVLATQRAAWQEALACFEEVLVVTRRLGFARDEVQTLERLAQVHLRRGSPADAVPPLREALTLASRLGDLPLADRVRATLAATHRSLGDLEAARHVLGPGPRRLRDPRQVRATPLLVQEGALAAASPGAGSARVLLTRALQQARAEGDREQERLAAELIDGIG